MASEVFSVRLHCFARHDAKVRIGQQKDEYRIRAHQPDTYRIAIHRNQAGYLCVVIESTPLLRGTVGHLIESLDFPGDERIDRRSDGRIHEALHRINDVFRNQFPRPNFECSMIGESNALANADGNFTTVG